MDRERAEHAVVRGVWDRELAMFNAAVDFKAVPLSGRTVKHPNAYAGCSGLAGHMVFVRSTTETVEARVFPSSSCQCQGINVGMVM
jgi:hypothetical protein